ncbi:dihydropteroate synthase [Yunchengibacter salinarum]|uniref:dihydropteroate synthase n=1 Tax=Yunchengibacter salinarum TaxID=3133399 RepID=UPI0035B5C9E1
MTQEGEHRKALSPQGGGASCWPVSALPPRLLPVGLTQGGTCGVPLGQTGRRFLGVRVLAREPGAPRFLDETVLGAGRAVLLAALMARVPSRHHDSLPAQLDALAAPRPAWTLPGGRHLDFTSPRIMGVLNVTPDSFSDGGDHMDPAAAVRHAHALLAAGAHIIDVGGESTRPGAEPVSPEVEQARILPVIRELAAAGITVSVDTRHAATMTAAVAEGAAIINDVSALGHDPDSPAAAARAGVPVILMHSRGTPRTMQDNPVYEDVVLDVADWLAQRLAVAEAAGIGRDRLAIDPGIGFGKRVVADNMALIDALPLFQTIGLPVMLGASRKRFIGAITQEDEARRRVAGSVAVALEGVRAGVQIVRVHDVAETRAALAMAQAALDTALVADPPAPKG